MWYSSPRLLRVSALAIFFCLVLGVASSSFGQLNIPKVTGPRPPVFVVRISLDLFDDLTSDQFEKEVPVDRVVLGTRAIGTAKLCGDVKIELETSDDEALFLVKLVGEAHSETVGHRRPVQLHGTGKATFRAEKVIRFDGVRFEGEPTEAEVDYESTIDRVTTELPRFLDCLIQRAAWRRIPKMKPQSERVAAEYARADVIAEFDKIAAELIVELNEVTPLEKTINLIFPETKTWKYHLSTTPTYLQAAVGPPGVEVPQLPPTADDVTDAPIEIWIRSVADADRVDSAVEKWDDAHEQLGEFLPEAAAQETMLVEHAQVIRVGSWTVITVGETTLEFADRLQRAVEAASLGSEEESH